MLTIISVFTGAVLLMFGSLLGYWARRSIAKKQANSLELKLQKKIKEAKEKREELILQAKKQAKKIISEAERGEKEIKEELLKTERFLRLKEEKLVNKEEKIADWEEKIREKVTEIKEVEAGVKKRGEEIVKKLEKVTNLSKKQAKEELFKQLEAEYEAEVLEKIRKVEKEGEEQLEARAKEILASAIQRYALSQAQEIMTTTVYLPDDNVKGKIIGKGGRNIKVLEKMTGTEILVDDTPGTVIISGFNPIRRQVARIALEHLIKDGRIQPSRIEDFVAKAEEEVKEECRKAGEQAVYQTGILGMNKNLVQLLGRLRFRTSYGQNILLHSIEVAELAGAIADEIGANRDVAKRGGMLHDIGKSMDREIEGSHIEIGMKILAKFGEKQEVIDAMKSHHEDYPPESVEAVIVQAADQISGARPGARKENIEEYVKRLSDLEKIATRIKGVKEAYAIQAGRELRVFVDPEKISDLKANRIAKKIAEEVEQELNYPGKIKVTLIREQRIVEYAK